MPEIEFLNSLVSQYLPWLALGIVVLAVFWLRTGTSLNTALIRTAALLLVLIGAGRPAIREFEEQASALALLDVSDSMDAGVTDRLLTTLGDYEARGLEIDVQPFAATSAPTTTEYGDTGSFSSLQSSWGALDIGGTDIGTALDTATLTGRSSILLISDGHSTKGDLSKKLDVVSGRRTRIFPLLPLDPGSSRSSFRVSHLASPLFAPAQKSVEVGVSVRNTTGTDQIGTLLIKHGDKTLKRSQVQVKAGEEIVINVESDPASEGIKPITATLTPNDSDLPASELTRYLSSEVREKVLVLSGDFESAKFLTQALSEQAYQLDDQVAPDRLPELENYNAVVLNNISKDQLPAGAMNKIKRYTLQGGGFLIIGGTRSFGLGGYRDTPIEEISPLEMLPPKKVQKRLNVAVQLVIDKSQSMGMGNKLEFAKEAARQVVKRLKNDDYVGVIGFDSNPFEVVRMDLLRRNRSDAIRRIGMLYPGLKTNMLPAIDEGRRRLSAAKAGRKHMIILTDGKIPDEGPYYIELVKQMRYIGITVSTVLLGSAYQAGMLRPMAEAGGGSFYQTNDPRSLPKIFLQDVRVNAGEQRLKEASEYSVRRGPGGLSSTSITSFPPVRGYVQTRKKNKAKLELVAHAKDKAEPLLASWTTGKGKAIAYTSDTSGRWSNYWVKWPRFRRFWSEILETLVPQGKDRERVRYDLRYSVEGDSLKLEMSIFGKALKDEIAAQLTVPGGAKKNISFQKIVEGRYEATLPAAMAGEYILKGNSGERKLTPAAFSLSGALFGEQKNLGFNVPELELIASRTGGRINPDPEELKDQVFRDFKIRELTVFPLLLALILLLLEILVRERLLKQLFKKFRAIGIKQGTRRVDPAR